MPRVIAIAQKGVVAVVSIGPLCEYRRASEKEHAAPRPRILGWVPPFRPTPSIAEVDRRVAALEKRVNEVANAVVFVDRTGQLGQRIDRLAADRPRAYARVHFPNPPAVSGDPRDPQLDPLFTKNFVSVRRLPDPYNTGWFALTPDPRASLDPTRDPAFPLVDQPPGGAFRIYSFDDSTISFGSASYGPFTGEYLVLVMLEYYDGSLGGGLAEKPALEQDFRLAVP